MKKSVIIAGLIEQYELKEKSTRDFHVAFLDLLEHVRRLPRDRLLDMLGMPDYFEEYDIGEGLFYVNVCRDLVFMVVVANGEFSRLGSVDWQEFLRVKPFLKPWCTDKTGKLLITKPK